MQLPEHLSIDALSTLLEHPLELSVLDLEKVENNYQFLQNKLKTGATFYGINTGFGSLCDVRVSDDQIQQLQENLVCSHACGFGDTVPQHIVKLILLLKIKNLSKGYSGIHRDTIERLVYLYNNNLLPVIYEQGSLGASGDLAPLAHLALPLLDKGQIWQNNIKVEASVINQTHQLQPLKLHAKEGLALLNGTQFMSAYASWALIKSQQLSKWADVIAAMSLEAFNGKLEPFTNALHVIRPHQGQLETASFFRSILKGSALQEAEKKQVQDPYSFRCIPQVHGATKDALAHIRNVVEIEINAVTDNPTVVEEEDAIYSGGNFHGQPLAINLDYAAIAMAELANISERRTYLLIGGTRDLPAFLAKDAGLNSGFMIAQYTAASIVSQNKQLCTPASVDSIVSSNGQEDHVSMGANAATKLKRVLDNVQRVLAIELLVAAQALDFKGASKSSESISKLHQAFREKVTFNTTDRVLHDDMVAAELFLEQAYEWYIAK